MFAELNHILPSLFPSRSRLSTSLIAPASLHLAREQGSSKAAVSLETPLHGFHLFSCFFRYGIFTRHQVARSQPLPPSRHQQQRVPRSPAPSGRCIDNSPRKTYRGRGSPVFPPPTATRVTGSRTHARLVPRTRVVDVCSASASAIVWLGSASLRLTLVFSWQSLVLQLLRGSIAVRKILLIEILSISCM